MNSLLKRLRENNVHVALHDGQLKISFDGELDQELLQELRQHKEQLVAYLSGKNSAETAFKPIPVVPENTAYPVSSAQKRLWVICQLDEVNVAYNEHQLELLDGEPDIPLLEQVCNTMIARYEVLRTGFIESEEGEPLQQIADAASIDFKIDVVDNGKLAGRDALVYLKEYLAVPFDLTKGTLFRVAAVEADHGRWALCFVLHHIICDGWSFELMIKEFRQLYMAGPSMSADSLPPLSIQYRDYAAWQRSLLESDEMQVHKSYWQGRFSDQLPVLDLATDFTRPVFKTYNGQRIRNWIDAELTSGIRQLSQDSGATLYMGLLATVNALFFRYTGQTDLVFGSPIAGREHPDLDNQLGFFLNTLALRTEFSAADSFKQLLAKVKDRTLEAYQHQDYPFDDLVSEIGQHFDKSRNPVFDVMVGLLNTKVGTNHAEAVENPSPSALPQTEKTGIDLTISKFDLTFNFVERDGGIYLGLEYNTDLFLPATIERLLGHYKVLLKAIIASPDSAISDLDCISAEERSQIMAFSGVPNPAVVEDSVIRRFERTAGLYPEKKAVCFDGSCLTYRELDELASRFSGFLQSELGVKKHDIAAISLERSEWQVIAQLAVMKAGAAYLPLDSLHPAERIRRILENSRSRTVIDQECIQRFLEQNPSVGVTETIAVDGTDPMYVIYTSGSTGEPKGVVVEHHSLLNLLEAYALEAELNASLTTNYTFDVSVLEIYSVLLSGGTLYLPGSETVLDPHAFAAFLCDHAVQHAYIHPMLLKEIAEALEEQGTAIALKRILTGVQKIQSEDIAWYLAKGIKVVNGYGPTETTVCATFYHVDEGQLQPGKQLPIGKPVANNAIYILDSENRLAGLGMTGELCVAGSGVARGYLHNPEMTEERFTANPFGAGRIYRTGDFGRWLDDGTIEFVGRRDEQVKINGYRIETGEIENALGSLDFVLQNAVVAMKDTQGDSVLIAYVSVKYGVTQEHLLEALRNRLPEYMIPAHFMKVDALPMTPNGKIDKKALPEPEDLGMSAIIPYVAPRNEIEEQLVELWKNLLGAERVGVKDNFFQLGGNSLKVIRLISQINKQFGLKYDLKGVYSESTIEAIAEKIRVDKWFKEDAGNHEEYTEIKI